ncbi:hypothetical protein ACET9K_08405 [Aeromonas enteropelogenes]|uniref:hypothetical protein n=1 Tax=Aeromonas enteropelogenes TaxID=29489 RepID=UPI0038CFA73B
MRLKLLELARQVSFDIGISLDELCPLEMAGNNENLPWRLRHGHGDEHHRNLYYALALIEKLKEQLGCTPEDEWQIFELVSIEKSIERFHSLAVFQTASIFPITKIGSLFLAILSLLNVAHRHFRHYTLHPYANYFSTQECIDIISCYYDYLVFHEEVMASIPMEPDMSEPILIGMVEQATSIASKVNKRARDILKELCRKDLNVKVSEFEKNAAKHISSFSSLLHQVNRDKQHLNVVIKARFDFEPYCGNKNDPAGIQAHAERFSKAISRLNDNLRRTATLKGFSNMESVLHAPEVMPWYQETFIVLRFPKKAYPFDYHKGSLALLCQHDENISKGLRGYAKIPRSKKYSDLLAKTLNNDTQQGSNLGDLVDILKAKKKDDTSLATTADIIDDLHRKMAIFDSVIFLQEAQERWHEYVEKYASDATSTAQQKDYPVTLFSMLLIDNKVVTPLVATPRILFEQSDPLDIAKYTHRQHQSVIANALQMLPFPTLNTMPEGLQNKVAIGISHNALMLLDIIKSSMVKLFFMKLNLKSLNRELDEVRSTSSSGGSKSGLMSECKSASLTGLKKIMKLYSM